MMKKLIIACIFIFVTQSGFCATYNVTTSAGLITVITNSVSGDIINVANGTYDLGGYSKTINYPLTITGAGMATTIIQNGGMFTLSAPGPLVVSEVTFNNWGNSWYFLVSVASGATLTGTSFTNCTFDGGAKGIAGTDVGIVGAITNFTVSGCTFQNFSSSSSVACVRLYTGTLTDINITNNTASNIRSTGNYCSVFQIGSNATIENSSDLDITGNTISNISGHQSYEVHGIVAYGDDVLIHNNNCSELTSPFINHEMIYWKASNSTASYNTVTNGGGIGGEGSMNVKGGGSGAGINNYVHHNTVTNSVGSGIFIHGGGTLENNIINVTGSNQRGLRVWPYGQNLLIDNNSITSTGDAIEYGATGGSPTNSIISNNCLASQYGEATDVDATGVTETNNTECEGSTCVCGAIIDDPATGNVIPRNLTETIMRSTGVTITLTLYAATWAATVGADNALTTALIAGMDSNQSEATGWDAIVKAGLTHADVTRTSDTVVTIVIPAFASFDIVLTETITTTIPASCTTAGVAIVCNTFYISAIEPVVISYGLQYAADAPAISYSSDAPTINYID